MTLLKKGDQRSKGPPADAGPGAFWLTEFEDPWPYRQAEADLYFHKADKQHKLTRPPIYRYVEVEAASWDNWLFLGIGLALVATGAALFVRQQRKKQA